MSRLLIDTDVIIEYLKGNQSAISYFKSLDSELHISAITLAELFTGIRTDEEKEELTYFISLFDVIPVSDKIAIVGGQLRQKWYSSHGMGLADALIAATAELHELTLISLNKKHFGMLTYYEIPYQK